MAGLQKKAGKKALAAAAPPPKPSQNIIAPPAPARYKTSALLTTITACMFPCLTLLDMPVTAALPMQGVRFPSAFKGFSSKDVMLFDAHGMSSNTMSSRASSPFRSSAMA